MVALVRTGRSVESLSREFQPCAATIHDWVKQASADDGECDDRLRSAERDELRQLRREVKAKGLRGVSRRKFVVTTERDPRARAASDLVDRNFYADAPNVL